MIEEKTQKFLRIQNLVIIIGIAIFIGGILVIFNDLDKRIKSLEDTVNQLTLEEEKIVLPEEVSGEGEETKKEEEEEEEFPKAWRETAMFSGIEGQKTDSFSVSSEEWRIRWELELNPEKVGKFSVNVFETDDQRLVESVSYNSLIGMTDYSESTYIYEGGASYYLDITVEDLERWQLKIETL